MRLRMTGLALLSSAILCSSIGSSATTNKAVGGFSLNKAISVRQMGMAGIGQSSGGMLAMWSNPAFLMDMETKGEFSVGGGAMNDGFESFGTLGGGWKLDDNWAVGGFMSIDGVQINEVNGFNETTGMKLNDDTIGFGVGGAYRWKWLTTGITLKLAAENIMDKKNTAPCSDMGMAGNWGDWGVGLSIRNLGGRLIQAEATDSGIQLYQDGVALPMEFRMGASYLFSGIGLTPAIELRKTLERDAQLGLGTGWKANNWLSLRMGIAGPIGAKTGSEPGSGVDFTMGITGLWKQYALDFAFVNAATGISSRVNLSYAIGERGAQAQAEPEPEKTREEVKQVVVAPLKPGDKKLNFAIADLRGENVSAGDAAVMADLLRNELVKTNTFTVIEKQNMDKVLSEHAFQQTGCSSEECAVKLGKLLNVQRMAVGSFGKLMDSYILSIRVVNVESGEIVYADSAEGEKVSQLRVGVKDMAARMARQIR